MQEARSRNIEQHTGGTRSTEAWRTIKALKQNNKERTHISYIQGNQWHDYYKKLLNEDRPIFLTTPTDHTDISQEITDASIEVTLQDVKNITKKFKNGTSPGPGGITSELIKFGSQKLLRMIQKMFEITVNGERLPAEWTEAYITLIFKKGERRKCDNYRSVSVIAIMGRVYGRLITGKLEDNIKGKIGEDQAGFTDR